MVMHFMYFYFVTIQVTLWLLCNYLRLELLLKRQCANCILSHCSNDMWSTILPLMGERPFPSRRTLKSKCLDNLKWPIFGAGERICAGRHLAQPFLKILCSELSSLPNFDPNRNHLYSGRGNDDNLTLGEILFFLNTIFSVILRRLYIRFLSPKPE